MMDVKLKSSLMKKGFDIIDKSFSKKDFNDVSLFAAVVCKVAWDRKVFKKYFKYIKKFLKSFENRFDETYLLVARCGEKIRVFDEFENRVILDFGYFLVEVLTDCGKVKEAENLDTFLSKVELGYKRYFYFNKLKVSSFSVDLGEFFYNDKLDEVDFYAKLDVILGIKNKKKKDTEFKKLFKYLEYFPRRVYFKSNKFLYEIEKSLFFTKNIEVKKFKKPECVLTNLNDLATVAKVLMMIKDE